MEHKLSLEFYLQDDVVHLGRSLVGKLLMSKKNGVLTGGIIVETESYKGAIDRACHAYNHLRTKRTEIMFNQGGKAYVYLCYGIHHLLNIVTNKKDIPEAILIRAIEPTVGIEHMLKRRNKKTVDYTLCSGPGSLTQALGITREDNGASLLGDTLWIEQSSFSVPEEDIQVGPRVGIAYAKEDALLPYRFRLKNNPWTSKANPRYV